LQYCRSDTKFSVQSIKTKLIGSCNPITMTLTFMYPKEIPKKSF